MHSTINTHYFDWLDLGGNLQRALRGVRAMRGGEARVLALVLFGICGGLAYLCWRFDIRPTLEWSRLHMPDLLRVCADPTVTACPDDTKISALPESILVAGPALGVLLTFLPTLAEHGMSRLAATGFRAAGIFVYAVSLFDAITDWPSVVAFMEPQRAWFASFGWLGYPLFYLARLGMLLMATSGFEMLFVVCLVCAIVLLINGFRAPASTQLGGRP